MLRNKSLPVFMAFLAMGFGDVVGPLVSLVKNSFEVSNFVASLMTTSGFIMFGLLSLPLGIIQDKRGKKFVLSRGLLVAFIGLMLPILFGMYGKTPQIQDSGQLKLIMLFISILLLGAGATMLQVSGNPIMRDVSPEGRYSSNLSLAQSIKAIGSSFGFLLPPAVSIWFGFDWTLLFPVYAFIVLITLIWINVVSIKEYRSESDSSASLSSTFSLLKNPFVALMVVGIFLYVGAEVSMSAQIPILMDKIYGIKTLGLWLAWALFFLPIFLGRLLGSFILRIVSNRRFLLITALLSIVGMMMLFFGSKSIAFCGIFLVGLGYANIFPLIFSITVDALPHRANELSGLMVMAIVGGALIPPITGAIADVNIMLGFIVPAACIFYVLILAISRPTPHAAEK
ncbi:MAG TPA: MFS transporter [Bacteroidales bacterium]|nr:MFS transporter [Bacteroidales bacterium]